MPSGLRVAPIKKKKSSPEDIFTDVRDRGRGKEGRREGGREEGRSVASRTCPNWGLTLQPFGAVGNAPTN